MPFILVCSIVLALPVLVNLMAYLTQDRQPKLTRFLVGAAHGLMALFSFLLLLSMTDTTVSVQYTVGSLRVGFFIDQIGASILLILALVGWQTVTSAPQLWTKKGFSTLITYCVSFAALVLLTLSDSLTGFLMFWVIADLSAFRIKEWKGFLLVYSASFITLFAALLFFSTLRTTEFVVLYERAEAIPPSALTFALACLFVGVAVKTAGFTFSIWTRLATETPFQTHFASALSYGLAAAMPGIYLLTRLYPLADAALYPPELFVGLTVTLILLLLPTFQRLSDVEDC